MTSEEKTTKEIIERYGETLDLKKNPYLIAEIVRLYGGRFGGGPAAECLPPAGPPKRFEEGDI